jgi:hypothetical protein
MGLFGPFQNDLWNLPATRPARLQPAKEDISSAEVIGAIGILLVSALVIVMLVGELLSWLQMN